MSSNPDGARGAKLQSNPSLPFLLGCCCIGLIMLAAALTIVMALIPTYLPDAGDGMSRVNATSMEAYLAAQATSGGKRAADPASFIGCSFDSTSLNSIANTMGQYVKNKKVTAVSVSEVIIGYLTSGKRKRSLLSRNSRATTLIYMIQAYFEVAEDCLYSCQLDVAEELQTKLSNIPSGAFALNNVYLSKGNSLCGVLDTVRFYSFYPLTRLSPGKTKRRPGSRPGLSYPDGSASATTPMTG